MSSVYKVEAYVDNEKTTTPVFFDARVHAVNFAFERAMKHAGGDASEVDAAYRVPPDDDLPWLFHSQEWVEPIVGDEPIKGDLLRMEITQVSVHDDPVGVPA